MSAFQPEQQIFRDFNCKADELAADLRALYPDENHTGLDSLSLGARNLAQTLKTASERIAKFAPEDQVVVIPDATGMLRFSEWMDDNRLPGTAYLCPSDANTRLGIFMQVLQGRFQDMLRNPEVLNNPEATAHYAMGARLVTALQRQLDLPGIKTPLPVVHRTFGVQ